MINKSGLFIVSILFTSFLLLSGCKSNNITSNEDQSSPLMKIPVSKDLVVENLIDEDETQNDLNITDVNLNNLGQGIYQIRISREGKDIDKVYGYAVQVCNSTDVCLSSLRRFHFQEEVVETWDEFSARHDKIRPKATVNFIDDWQGETAYLKVPSGILVSKDSKGTIRDDLFKDGEEIEIDVAALFVGKDGKIIVGQNSKDRIRHIKRKIKRQPLKNIPNGPRVTRRGNSLEQIVYPKDRNGETVYGDDKPDVVGPGIGAVSTWNFNIIPGSEKIASLGVYMEEEEESIMACASYDPTTPRPRIEFWNCLNTSIEAKPGSNTIQFGSTLPIKSGRTSILTIPYDSDGAVVGNPKWVRVKIPRKKATFRLNGWKFYKVRVSGRMNNGNIRRNSPRVTSLGANTLVMGVTFVYAPGEGSNRPLLNSGISINCKDMGVEPITFDSRRVKINYKKNGTCNYKLDKFRFVNKDGSLSDTYLDDDPGRGGEIQARLIFTGNKDIRPARIDVLPDGRVYYLGGIDIGNGLPEGEIDNDISFEASLSDRNGTTIFESEGFNPKYTGKKKGSFFLSVQVSGKSLASEKEFRLGHAFRPLTQNSPPPGACTYDPSAEKPRVEFWKCLDVGIGADDEGTSIIFPKRAKRGGYELILIAFDKKGDAVAMASAGPIELRDAPTEGGNRNRRRTLNNFRKLEVGTKLIFPPIDKKNN